MFRDKVSSRRLSAWLFAGIIPAVIQLAGGASWMWMLPVVAGCLMGVLLRWHWGTAGQGRIFAVLGWGTAVAVLGTVAPKTMDCWPVGTHVAVPLLLLALAAWSAIKGPSAAARTGCVLFWFVLVIYSAIIAAGVREAEPRWMLNGQRGNWLVIPLLLTPAAAAVLAEGSGGWGKILLISLFTLTASLITLGVLGSNAGSAGEQGFYEMSRSLSLLHTARRFEAVLSAAMTVGWFSVMSLFLVLCGHYAHSLKAGMGRFGVIAGAVVSGGMTLCGLHIPALVLAVWTSVFWVVLPLLLPWIVGRKKS